MVLKRVGLAAFALLAIASPAAANPADIYGFGSRETAMGNAAAAETHGFAASYYNPAGLVRSTGVELSVGYFHAAHSLAMNGKDNDVDPVKGVVGGMVVPGRVLGLPFAFGLALHLPDERLSRVNSPRQEQPRWELYDNRSQRLYFAANLAVAPTPWLAIGGGLSFMSATRGKLDISGTANVFNPDGSNLRHEVDADLTAVRYPQAGVRVALSDRVALAAVYRGQFKLDLDLAAHIFGDLSGLTTALYDLQTHSVNNFLPQQVVVGGSWELVKGLKTTFDATWIDWSAYESPVTKIDLVVDIPPPAGGWPPGITPPTVPQAPKIVPLALHDRVVPHVGIEWHALRRPWLDGFLRAGYEVAKSPFPPQTGITNYVDRDRHTFSFGLGAEAYRASLDLHLQISELVTETTRKASPADLVGDYTAGGHIVNAGVTAGYRFR